MNVLGFFRRSRPAGTATNARDRLQILLAHERSGPSSAELLTLLQRDILEAIERRMKVGRDQVEITLDHGDDLSTVEINIEFAGAPALASLRAS